VSPFPCATSENDKYTTLKIRDWRNLCSTI